MTFGHDTVERLGPDGQERRPHPAGRGAPSLVRRDEFVAQEIAPQLRNPLRSNFGGAFPSVFFHLSTKIGVISQAAQRGYRIGEGTYLEVIEYGMPASLIRGLAAEHGWNAGAPGVMELRGRLVNIVRGVRE